MEPVVFVAQPTLQLFVWMASTQQGQTNKHKQSKHMEREYFVCRFPAPTEDEICQCKSLKKLDCRGASYSVTYLQGGAQTAIMDLSIPDFKEVCILNINNVCSYQLRLYSGRG